MIQGDSLSPTFLHRDLEKTPLHHRRNPPPTTCPQNPCPIFLHGLTPVSSLLHPAQSVSSAGIWFFALGLPPRAHGSCLQAGSAADSSWWVFFFFGGWHVFSSPTCISQENTLAAERLENIEMEEKLKTSKISSEITTFKTVVCVCVCPSVLFSLFLVLNMLFKTMNLYGLITVKSLSPPLQHN